MYTAGSGPGWQQLLMARYVNRFGSDDPGALDLETNQGRAVYFDACRIVNDLGRNLRHLVTVLEDLEAVGVSFVSLGEGIDCTTPSGKLQLHILAALAEFERERIRERVLAG